MDSILEALLQWISDNSSYETSSIRLPSLVEMTPGEITAEFYAGHKDKMPINGIDKRINALYDAEKEILYVIRSTEVAYADEFTTPTENPIWREIVLHELVHHVQWQSGQINVWPCTRYGEKEAYILGGKYLQQKNTDDPLLNRKFWANIYSRC